MSGEYDPLDMSNYRIERLAKREKGKVEKWLAIAGIPLALAAFILLGFVIEIPFLRHIEPAQLVSKTARGMYETLGETGFIRTNAIMLAVFAAALILWITEAIPNYLTSLIIIISLVLTGVLPENEAYAQLGHPVMWLNIMSFVLASMLVSTGVAKRFALWFIVTFGKNAGSIFISFLIINLILSIFISATTAKAAILLPVFMVIAAIYGSRPGTDRNNFGRSLVLQNLLNINVGAGLLLTGSGANLLAAALIGGAIGSRVYFSDWMYSQVPVTIAIMFIGYWLAMKVFFPLKPEERTPRIEGGMERLQGELQKLGRMSMQEKKAIVIFVLILAFWATDRLHGVSATAVAFVGGIVALMPKIGIVRWKDVDIPWHLMLFSAGAYTLGAGFDYTDLPSLSVNALFDHLGLGSGTPFWVLYLMLTGFMMFSSLIFQSKTMRAMVFIPIAIGVANRFGFSVISLAMPVAFMINHVYVLPFNSKPAVLLYETDQYSLSDTFKYGITVMTIAWILNIIAGETWYKLLGITPDGVFGLF